MSAERLQKLLSRRGLASRREAEAWILAGRVRVNGAVITELGFKADPASDQVEVDGRPLPNEAAPIVVLLNKPAGYTATVRDPHAERTVMDLLHGLGRRVYPVGRLDRDTRGVLLLTDDGDLAHALLHPSRGVEKVYEVVATGDLSEDALRRLATGVELEDGLTLPARVWGVHKTASGVRFQIALREGRKRQVRLMVRAVGGRVAELVRVSFAGLTVGGLAEGEWRLLKPQEVTALRRGAPERPAKRGSARKPATKPASSGAGASPPGRRPPPAASARRAPQSGPRAGARGMGSGERSTGTSSRKTAWARPKTSKKR